MTPTGAERLADTRTPRERLDEGTRRRPLVNAVVFPDVGVSYCCIFSGILLSTFSNHDCCHLVVSAAVLSVVAATGLVLQHLPPTLLSFFLF